MMVKRPQAHVVLGHVLRTLVADLIAACFVLTYELRFVYLSTRKRSKTAPHWYHNETEALIYIVYDCPFDSKQSGTKLA